MKPIVTTEDNGTQESLNIDDNYPVQEYTLNSDVDDMLTYSGSSPGTEMVNSEVDLDLQTTEIEHISELKIPEYIDDEVTPTASTSASTEQDNYNELNRMLTESRLIKKANGKRAVIKAKKTNIDNGENATDWNSSEIKDSYNNVKSAAGAWDSNWDKLRKQVGQATNVDAGLGSRLPTACRNVYLIRHGQYHQHKNDDDEETLTDLGISQAALTGARLASLGVTFDRLVHSTMSRARETAEGIWQHVMPDRPMEKCDLLREGCPVQPVPKLRGYKPNGVMIHKDEYRIEAAYRKYIYRADVAQRYQTHDILICHGNVIRYFVCRALQLPTEGWLRLSIQNASITHIVIEGSGKVRLKSYAAAGHLPIKQLTSE